jgi:hypothetical protein
MYTKFTIIASAVFLASCAGSGSIKSESYGPTGKKSYEISCNGLGSSLGPCFSEAGKACGKSGYNVIRQYADAPFYNLVVECK